MIMNIGSSLLPLLTGQMRVTYVGAILILGYGITACMTIASPPTEYDLSQLGTSGVVVVCRLELVILDNWVGAQGYCKRHHLCAQAAGHDLLQRQLRDKQGDLLPRQMV